MLKINDMRNFLLMVIHTILIPPTGSIYAFEQYCASRTGNEPGFASPTNKSDNKVVIFPILFW